MKRIGDGKDVLGEGGQTLTVMGDHGLCLNVICVPDTGMNHLDRAMNEILDRHAPGSIPKVLFVDCACCNGKLVGTFGRAGERWKRRFEHVSLDGMHLIMRLSREVNGEHPRRAKLLRDLSRAIYERDPVDMARLKRARNKAGLTMEVLGDDLHRFVKAHIKGGEHTSNRMKAVVALI